MNIGKKEDQLSIAVIINKLSWEQLVILGKHFEHLPKKLNVLLVKRVPCLPVSFYQLREILLLEKQMEQTAKEELFKAGRAFNIPAIRKVVCGSTLIHVFQALPEIDHLIGHGLDQHRFFVGSQHPDFIGGLRRWVERYAVSRDLEQSRMLACIT